MGAIHTSWDEARSSEAVDADADEEAEEEETENEPDDLPELPGEPSWVVLVLDVVRGLLEVEVISHNNNIGIRMCAHIKAIC